MSEVVALDLQTFRDQTWNMRVTEELVLHVGKPSESLFIKLHAAQADLKAAGDEDPQVVFGVVTGFLTEALSNNREEITVDEKWFEQNHVDLSAKLEIFRSYAEFVMEVMGDPNSNSPRKA